MCFRQLLFSKCARSCRFQVPRFGQRKRARQRDYSRELTASVAAGPTFHMTTLSAKPALQAIIMERGLIRGRSNVLMKQFSLICLGCGMSVLLGSGNSHKPDTALR